MNAKNFSVYHIGDECNNYLTLIHDYWEINEKLSAFKYSTKELLLKYGFKSLHLLEDSVSKYSYITSESDLFRCQNCGEIFKIKLRNEYKKLTKSQFECNTCLAKENDKLAQEILCEIESIIEDKYDFLFKKNTFNLTYLEKIYLYLIVYKCQVNEFGKLNKESWQDMFITERADKNFLIKSLYAKKVIFSTKNREEIQKIFHEKNPFFMKKAHSISLDILNKYKKYRYLFNDENTFLNFDLEYENFNHLLENLSKQFEYYELDYLDVKEIREFIIEQKIIDAYKLISNIQKYRPIPIEKSIELDCVLVELVEKYNLLVVNSLLNYQADKVASSLYSLEHGERKDRDHYFVNKMFIARITSYLEYCKLNNRIPSHVRGIGLNWSYTSLEYFVSKSIINEGLSWTTFSGDDLIHKWLNSEKVTIKPDL